MQKIIILFFLGILMSCESDKNAAKTDVYISFDTIESTYFEERWELDPKTASHFRFEKYNDQLIPFTENYLNSVVDWAKGKLIQLKKVDYFTLSDNQKIDLQIIKNDLDATIFWIDKVKYYTWNPEIYNLYALFMITINGNESLEKKLYNVNERLKVTPEFYKVGQQNLSNPSKESTVSAINRLEIEIDLIDKIIKDSIEVSSLSKEMKTEYLGNLKNAKDAQLSFAEFLKEKLANENSEFRSFRIGNDLYPRFYESFISKLIDEKQTHDLAVAYKDDINQKMKELTLLLWDKYYPNEPIPELNKATRKLIIKICKSYPASNQTIDSINNILNYNIDFINKNDLLFHPKDDLPKIILQDITTHPDQVEFSIMGNLNPLGITQSPVYNIQTIKDYSNYKEDVYYTRYNKFTFEIIAMILIPGYYSKYLHSPKDISTIKSVFRKGSNKNGWAAYAQQMMISNNYNNDNDLKNELLLIHYKFQLRMVCNAIVTYQVHTKDWSREQVEQLLKNDAFMEDEEIEGEWESLTQLGAELTGTFNGFIEITRLRDEIKVLEGEFFDLQKFHEEFLSYGYTPIDIIRQLMLDKYEGVNYNK